MLVTALLWLPLLTGPQDGPQERPDPPRTVPEASGYVRTSTQADVLELLAALEPLPHPGRIRVQVVGQSHEGRDLVLVSVGAPLPDAAAARDERLRLLVNGSIHAGEVEGKEAIQAILRELALGEHEDLLAHAVLHFVPIYNVDGNERIDVANRASQNGPAGGVGERANAQGLDLNRDFVKVESPECSTLLALFNQIDPHLFMDLHTTNGSFHGYHLTYSPSLATNVDPELDAFARDTLLPDVTRSVGRHGWRIEHYGNFTGRWSPWPSGDEEADQSSERRWATYDHRPRFGTNYFALRNRVAVLSEAYSYLDFRPRIEVTRAFVLATLRSAVRHRQRLVELCAAADARCLSGVDARGRPLAFGYDSSLEEPVPREILVGEVRRVPLEGGGERREALPKAEPELMGVQDRFISRAGRPLPRAWIVQQPSAEVLARLDAHGIEYSELSAPPGSLQRFEIEQHTRAGRPFQGHHEVRLRGAWRSADAAQLSDAIRVPARQRLARVAAQLLEPESEDSLTTWNFFDHALQDPGEEGGGPVTHPVWRELAP